MRCRLLATAVALVSSGLVRVLAAGLPVTLASPYSAAVLEVRPARG